MFYMLRPVSEFEEDTAGLSSDAFYEMLKSSNACRYTEDTLLQRIINSDDDFLVKDTDVSIKNFRHML